MDKNVVDVGLGCLFGGGQFGERYQLDHLGVSIDYHHERGETLRRWVEIGHLTSWPCFGPLVIQNRRLFWMSFWITHSIIKRTPVQEFYLILKKAKLSFSLKKD